jgi:hypothetical protein
LGREEERLEKEREGEREREEGKNKRRENACSPHLPQEPEKCA